MTSVRGHPSTPGRTPPHKAGRSPSRTAPPHPIAPRPPQPRRRRRKAAGGGHIARRRLAATRAALGARGRRRDRCARAWCPSTRRAQPGRSRSGPDRSRIPRGRRAQAPAGRRPRSSPRPCGCRPGGRLSVSPPTGPWRRAPARCRAPDAWPRGVGCAPQGSLHGCRQRWAGATRTPRSRPPPSRWPNPARFAGCPGRV